MTGRGAVHRLELAPSGSVPVRSSVTVLVLTFALCAPAAAQEQAPQERLSLGADSLFGPGIVDLSPNGSAAKLRLVRPAHVVVFALRGPLAQLVLPRRSETRVSRVGDQWIDLPWPVTPDTERRAVFVVGRVEVGGRPAAPGLPPSGTLPATAVPPSGAAPSGTVTLVIVSDSAWSRDAIAAVLPREPQLMSAMALAHAIAAALLGSRSDTCAAYLVRW